MRPRPLLHLLLITVVSASAGFGQDRPLPIPHSVAAASPEQDDATLRDVCFVDTRVGVAVGDRGVIWRTRDSGLTWELIPSGTEAVLHAVQLTGGQTGWAVGTEIRPTDRQSRGVVLRTEDLGQSWKRMDDGSLPGLKDVHFFSGSLGIAVGHSTAQVPTGVLVTEDGGRTWAAASGRHVSSGWHSVAFENESNGVAVGPRGQIGLISSGRLLDVIPGSQLRGLHAVVLSPEGSGWLVGDGAHVRTTTTHGLSWPEPEQPLPRELDRCQDFLTASQFNSGVWIGGAPGSVVWHSPDSGATWQRQATGDPTPIQGLHFVTPQFGCAVGAFGRISLTSDGGRTWHTVRGGQRRAALLVLTPGAGTVPLSVLARESGENGYRSVVSGVARRDAGTEAAVAALAPDRLTAAVLRAGGNVAATDWQLPVDRPDVAMDREQLVRYWSQVTDRKLGPVLLEALVTELRTWRPEVVLLPPAGDHAVAGLIHEAIAVAIDQAAGPDRFPAHGQLLGLGPWQVSKLVEETPEPDESTIRIDGSQLLVHRRQTVEAVTESSAQLLLERDNWPATTTHLRVLQTAGAAQAGDSAVASRSLFGGLEIPHGSAARRGAPRHTEFNHEELLQLTRHQRNLRAYAAQLLDDPQRAGQLLAQLQESTRVLAPEDAARLLEEIAHQYWKHSEWDLAESTLVLLAERYPGTPAAGRALEWLLVYWSSEELAWQRLRMVQADSPSQDLNRVALQASLLEAQRIVQTAGNSLEAELEIANLPDAIERRSRPGVVRAGGLDTALSVAEGTPAGTDQRSIEALRWQQQAARAAELISRADAAWFSQPSIQFLLASLLRRQQNAAAANEIFRRHFGLEDGLTPWNVVARGELWITARGALSPAPVLRCIRFPDPPLLDGLLEDPCWLAATEVRLTSATQDGPRSETFVEMQSLDRRGNPRTDNERSALVMLGYDAEYLYLAAVLPAHPDVRRDPVQMPGRQHDADLEGFDRIRLTIDVDRDYASYYLFEIDQRGWTRESLWKDDQWNPQWHVAATREGGLVRIEAAIPLRELTPIPPVRGDVWTCSLTRLIPGAGIQSWSQPASITVRPETFGLLQFD